MKKLITFSLWGDDPKYTVGALRNAELAPKIYPGWACRFYKSITTPRSLGHEMLDAFLDNGGQVKDFEVIVMPDEGWKGMFWRFYPASEDDVDVFISRDCDSRLNEREAISVKQWLTSPMLLHVMRDHPHHNVPILGGMWGAKRHCIPNMVQLIDNWNKEDRWQTDQEFLRDVIWPQFRHKSLVYDDWKRFNCCGATVVSFPTPRVDDNFVGAIIGPNEERLHPEHHAMLRS